jgi:hypothetical protein
MTLDILSILVRGLIGMVFILEAFALLWMVYWLIGNLLDLRCDYEWHSYKKCDKEYGFAAKKCKRCDKLKI